MSVRLEVLRAFWLDGRSVQPGEVLAVSRGFAAELCSSGKAKPAPPASPPEAPLAEPPPASVAPRRTRRPEPDLLPIAEPTED
jgi:hypothetical protein